MPNYKPKQRRRRRKVQQPTIVCAQCGTPHTRRRAGSIYCSKACATKASSIRRADHRREAARKWHQEHAEQAHAKAKKYRQANRDKEAERVRRWQQTPKGRARAELEGNATPEFIEAKWDASDKTCCLCGQPIDDTLPGTHRMGRTLEHLTPLSRGGRNDIDNLDFAHRSCNSSKKEKTLEEYRERLR
jgi:5-methylcytosine-specific restriction endonuclease McrA